MESQLILLQLCRQTSKSGFRCTRWISPGVLGPTPATTLEDEKNRVGHTQHGKELENYEKKGTGGLLPKEEGVCRGGAGGDKCL